MIDETITDYYFLLIAVYGFIIILVWLIDAKVAELISTQNVDDEEFYDGTADDCRQPNGWQ